jgi:tetratricopeptide (TPR) repeat protein
MTRSPSALLLLSALVATAIGCAPATTPVQTAVDLDFPSPMSGPGVGVLTKTQSRHIDHGWRALASGDVVEAEARAQRAGQIPPAQLLAYQVMLTEGEVDVTGELEAFCGANREFAAAWITLSVAAERTGSEATALSAARHGASLWDAEPWSRRADDLYQRWVTDRIQRSRELFEQGEFEAAMDELGNAQELDADRTDIHFLEAEILVASGRLDEAEEILGSLPNDPETLLLRGHIAERKGDWQRAMDSYSDLPPGHPDRAAALERAQIRWRLSVLPAYAQRSLNAAELTRADLAVALVSVQPRLETLPGGDVPVISDIVDHPGQREIVTVVRLGIMTSDRRAHRFHPDRPVDADAVRESIERSSGLLGLPNPTWCGDNAGRSANCYSIPSPPSGEAVVGIVLAQASGGGP